MANLGGTWHSGVARAIGTYMHEHVDGATTATGRGGQIGGVGPDGSGEVRLSDSSYRKGSGATTAWTRTSALGYARNLTKRSVLYATYARVNNSGVPRSLNGSTTTGNHGSSGIRGSPPLVLTLQT